MSDHVLRFGPFQLDVARRELLRDGELMQLGGRALDILCVLASAKGKVVSKDELLARVWAGLTVEENNIQVHVSALRKALDEGSGGRSYVVTVPARGYRFVDQQVSHSNNSETTPRPAIPDRPSIAVLPFVNLSGDPDQQYFADGTVEEIITALSRMNWLFVIARNSSFTYRGCAVDVKQIGRELGVRYVLEGSVRKSGTHVRVAGQLIDATTGAHLWADRFDGELADIFDLQDQVTASVVGAVGPRLERAEIERAKQKPTESLDAYDYYLRGLASVYRGNSDGIAAALKMLYRAIESDPEFARAHGMAAWCYALRSINGWTTDRSLESGETARLAKCVMQSGKDDAVALSFGGLGFAYVAGDIEAGAAMIDRALLLNPNLAVAWNASGWVRTFLSETDVAIEHLSRAMQLSPLDPQMFWMQTLTAMAHFLADQYEAASMAAAKAIREQPDFLAALRMVAASNVRTGRLGKAREAMARARQLDPGLRLSNLKDRVGPLRAQDFAKYAEALRLAGLPE